MCACVCARLAHAAAAIDARRARPPGRLPNQSRITCRRARACAMCWARARTIGRRRAPIGNHLPSTISHAREVGVSSLRRGRRRLVGRPPQEVFTICLLDWLRPAGRRRRHSAALCQPLRGSTVCLSVCLAGRARRKRCRPTATACCVCASSRRLALPYKHSACRRWRTDLPTCVRFGPASIHYPFGRGRQQQQQQQQQKQQ